MTAALAVVAVVAVAVSAVPAAAAEPGEKLQTIERALGKARERQTDLERRATSAAAERDRVRRKSVTIAARMQRHEAAMSSLEEQMSALAFTEAEKSRFLEQRKAQLVMMLGALQRIAHHPPGALIALPTSPNDTVRSAILLRAAVPALEAQAGNLSDDLKALAGVRRRIFEARNRLKTEARELRAQRLQLASLTKEKVRLARETRAESVAASERAYRLGAEARNLRELMIRLQEERDKKEERRKEKERQSASVPPPPPPQPKPQPQQKETAQRPPAPAPEAPHPFAPATPPVRLKAPAQVMPEAPTETVVEGRPPRSLTPTLEAALTPGPRDPSGLPVRGRITRSFGQDGGGSGKSKGITIRARPAAQVVAPSAGEVVFAGPFRGFGQLLIIEHRARYHMLLAGMARIDAAVGDRVMAGEPVGVMNDTTGGRPALYMELRRSGRPINPLPWLAARTTKVKG